MGAKVSICTSLCFRLNEALPPCCSAAPCLFTGIVNAAKDLLA